MSAGRACVPGDKLTLAHEFAQLWALLPGPDNSHRQALAAIASAIVPWRLGTATADAVLVEVAKLSGPAFLDETDFGRPECWLLGAVSAVLGAHTAVELPATPDGMQDFDEGNIAVTVGGIVVKLCAGVARMRPEVMQKGVTPKQYMRAGEAIAKRIEDIGSAAIRDGLLGPPLQ